MRGVPMLVDLDLRFRVMDAFDGYQQVLSLPTPPIEVDRDGARRRRSRPRRQRRDGGARRSAIPAVSGVRGVAAAQRSRRRDARSSSGRSATLGARGIQLFTQHQRHAARRAASSCRSSRRWPATTCRSGCIRTAARDVRRTTRRKIARSIEIWWTFGWPYETSVAMARMVFAGLFDRFPALKIITHHMGAMAPYFEGRVGPGWDQLGARTSDAGLCARC